MSNHSVDVAVTQESDGTWIAEVVGQPEIRAIGNSLEDLELNIKEVLALWRGGSAADYAIEGLPGQVASA